MPRKIAALALLFFSALACIASPSQARRPWTVLVYMAADNDLEESALEDLAEMAASGAGASFNLLVLADRGCRYSSDGAANLPAWKGARLLCVESGRLRQLEDWGEVDMGSPETLSRFVAAGLAACPASRNALVFWDHGGAWTGFGSDGTDGASTLEPGELRSGLSAGLAAGGLGRLDLVGFDACLMASFEAMDALEGLASYFLASEELEPGHGWDYRSLAGLGPALGPVELGKALVAGYLAQAEAEKDRDRVTISLVDLGRFPQLESAVADFAAASRASMPLLAGGLGRMAGAALSFGKAGRPEEDSHMVDLGALAQAAAEQPALAAPAAALEKALSSAVLVAESGRLCQGSSGVSIYFPNQRKLYDQAYEARGHALWRGLLASYFEQGASRPEAAAPRFEAEGNLGEAVFDEEGVTLRGRLAPGCAAGVVAATLYYGVVDEGSVIFLGDQDADLDQASGRVEGFWDRSVLSLSQGRRSTYGYLSLSAQEGGATLYSIPFAYFADGKVRGEDYDYAYMDLVVDEDGEILGSSLFKENDAGLTAELRPVKGSKLVPLVELLGEDGETSMEMTEDWGFDARDWESIELDYEDLPAGQAVYLELQVADAADAWDYLYFEGELD